MTSWRNFYLSGKHSKLTEGHLPADKLLDTILNSDGETAYACYFDLDKETLKLEYDFGDVDSMTGKKVYTYLKQGEVPPNREHKKPKVTFTAYDVGMSRPALNLISFDFDSEEDPEQSLSDVKRFCEWLAISDLGIFYSGSKGFHVVVPFGYFPLEASPELPNQLKDLAQELKKIYPTMDASIYQYNRKFRVPFTKHETTGRFKTWIPVEQIQEISMDEIINRSEHRNVFNFMEDLGTSEVALEVLITAFEQVKRNSYVVEKERAGTKEAPSPFEKFDDKKCIQKLLTSRCDDVGRNNAAIVIVNDFYRTGKTIKYAEETMAKWCADTGLPYIEVATIISNIFNGRANYNYGCQNEIKALYCSAKCGTWSKLDPDKRPVTVDQPASTEAQKIKDSITAKDLLSKVFQCQWDDIRQEFVGGNILVHGASDLFYYDEGRWIVMDAPYIARIKRRLNMINNGKLDAKRIDQMFKYFMMYVPHAPEGVDMWTPNPTCANFNNGTLHLLEDINGKFYLEFKKHNPKDYLTFKIEHNYDPNFSRTNVKFDTMLNTIFEEDAAREDKIKSISEMYGAALIPFFPHLFYLYGEANSGKSTIILILHMLLGKGNISHVEPKDFHGFNLEAMVGKLVNMVTDVDTKRPMSDNVVKQIEDRALFTIRRKNRSDIQAPLPSVQIFGGNDLIPSYEGYSKAMQRRWTIYKFDKAYTGPKMRNFVSHVFNSDPQGIINFAIGGLHRLVESQGYFTKFDASEIELKNWGEESDTIAQFIDAGLHGETHIGIVKHENAKIERKVIWDIFNKWQEDSGHKYTAITKAVFYKRLAAKGYEIKTFAGFRYFVGLGELATGVSPVQNSNVATDII